MVQLVRCMLYTWSRRSSSRPANLIRSNCIVWQCCLITWLYYWLLHYLHCIVLSMNCSMWTQIRYKLDLPLYLSLTPSRAIPPIVTNWPLAHSPSLTCTEHSPWGPAQLEQGIGPRNVLIYKCSLLPGMFNVLLILFRVMKPAISILMCRYEKCDLDLLDNTNIVTSMVMVTSHHSLIHGSMWPQVKIWSRSGTHAACDHISRYGAGVWLIVAGWNMINDSIVAGRA